MITENTIEDTDEAANAGLLRRVLIRGLWISLVIAISGFVYVQLMRADVLPIEEVKVRGQFEQLHASDLQPIIANDMVGNFFTVNVDELYEKLHALPWVEKIWIHRIWPNTITIDVQEQRPIAILKNEGLLNKNGDVFSLDFAGFEQILPLFVVAKSDRHEAVVQYQKKIEILNSAELTPRIFYYDARESQTIKFKNGIELVLGRVDVDSRLVRFVKAYKSYLRHDTRKIRLVDLRYTNGLAVSWVKTSGQSEHDKKKLT